jgi:hypothetical protein
MMLLADWNIYIESYKDKYKRLHSLCFICNSPCCDVRAPGANRFT